MGLIIPEAVIQPTGTSPLPFLGDYVGSVDHISSLDAFLFQKRDPASQLVDFGIGPKGRTGLLLEVGLMDVVGGGGPPIQPLGSLLLGGLDAVKTLLQNLDTNFSPPLQVEAVIDHKLTFIRFEGGIFDFLQKVVPLVDLLLSEYMELRDNILFIGRVSSYIGFAGLGEFIVRSCRGLILYRSRGPTFGVGNLSYIGRPLLLLTSLLFPTVISPTKV